MLLATLGGNPKFYITYNGVTYEYQFIKGMTWTQFASSEFNDGNKVRIYSGKVYFNGTTDKILNSLPNSAIEEKTYSTLAPLYLYKGTSALINCSVIQIRPSNSSGGGLYEILYKDGDFYPLMMPSYVVLKVQNVPAGYDKINFTWKFKSATVYDSDLSYIGWSYNSTEGSYVNKSAGIKRNNADETSYTTTTCSFSGSGTVYVKIDYRNIMHCWKLYFS